MATLAGALGDANCSYYRSADDRLLADLVEMLLPGDILLVEGSNRVFWARDFVKQIEHALTN